MFVLSLSYKQILQLLKVICLLRSQPSIHNTFGSAREILVLVAY